MSRLRADAPMRVLRYDKPHAMGAAALQEPGELPAPAGTDWQRYRACPVCPALPAHPCYSLSSGGPDALPPRRAETPHHGRKLSTRAS